MPITGSWSFVYDWGCDGSYGKASITINANGTFNTSDGYTGLWVQTAGMIIFSYNGSRVTYAGNLASKSITGISSTFTGSNGCFYMLQSGVPAAAHDEKAAGKQDSAGK